MIRNPERNSEMSIDNSLRIYLDEIGQYDLLTREQECELSTAYKAGIEAEIIAQELMESGQAITPEIQQTIEIGAEAKERFINSNLRLVVSIAKIYQNDNHSLEFLDLIQEGNEGLFKAIEKFDSDKGFKFSTYATWWIKQSIQKGIDNTGKIIRIPIYASDKLYAYERVVNDLACDNQGTKLTDEQIADKLGLEREQITQLNKLKTLNRSVLSIDKPLSDEYGSETISDYIIDENQNPGTFVDDIINIDLMNKLLDYLPERPKTVIIERFGLCGVSPKTLEEVGEKFGLTGERIRQIEQKALKSLRDRANEIGAYALLVED